MAIQKRQARRQRIRSRITGTVSRPRVSVHRSTRGLTVQLIDDESGHTLLTGSSKAVTGDSKVAKATTLGEQVAAAAIKLGIVDVVFDRSGYLYHGRIKALAEGMRAGGLHL